MGGIGHTEVSFICIESSREPVYITGGVCTAAAAGDSRDSNEHGRFFVFGGEEGGCSYV